MPIEIRELVVRAHVDAAGDRASGGTGPCTPRTAAGGQRQEDLVLMAVEKAMRSMADRRER